MGFVWLFLKISSYLSTFLIFHFQLADSGDVKQVLCGTLICEAESEPEKDDDGSRTWV